MTKNKKETIFKNTVGRPTNEIKRKRRMFIASAIMLGVLLVGGIFLKITSSNFLKADALSGTKVTATYASASGGASITPKLAKKRIVVEDVTENSLKVQYVYYRTGDVANSQDLQIPDGKLDSHDANMILRISARLETMDETISRLSDVNVDGKILADDARLVLRMIADSPFGDANGDKRLDNTDKKIYYDFLYNNKAISSAQKKRMDINGDGKVDKKDYTILSYFGGDKICVSKKKDSSYCTWKYAGYKANNTWTSFGNLEPNTTYYIYVKTFNDKATYIGSVKTKEVLLGHGENDTEIKKTHSVSAPKYSNDELVINKTVGKFKVTVSPSSDNVTVQSSDPSVIQIIKYGDNSSSNNNWGLKVKKPGSVTITVKSYVINNGKTEYKKEVKYKYVVPDPNKKTYKVTFKRNSATKSLDGDESKSEIIKECTVKNGKCTVVAPKIKLNTTSVYAYAQWSTSSGEGNNVISSGNEINVTENRTYYVYSQIIYDADFHYFNRFGEPQDLHYDCIAINSSSCVVSKKDLTPISELYEENSYSPTLEGFTRSKSGITINYKSGKLTLNSSRDYYAILKNPKKIVLTLDGNGSDYKTSSINYEIKRADGKDGIKTLPRFNFPGGFSMYWCDKKDCTGKKYSIGSKINVLSNTKLYATNYLKKDDNGNPMFPKTFNVTKSYKVGNVNVEIVNGLERSNINKNYLESVYKKVGKNGENIKLLFSSPVKMIAMSENDYKTTKYCGLGCTYSYSGNSYSLITLNYESNHDENIYIHELGHAFDHAYFIKFGTQARNTKIFTDFYNKYKDYIEIGDKKTGEIYSPTEFFAATMSNYYWTYVANKPDHAFYAIDQTKAKFTQKDKCTTSKVCKDINSDLKKVVETIFNDYNNKK